MKTDLIFKRYSVLTVFLLAISVRGQGTFVYDQQSVSSDYPGGVGAGFQQDYPIGQSFTPTLDSVGFIRLAIDGGGQYPGSAATFYVNLMSDSISGTIIGSTETVTIPPIILVPWNFIFSTPVSVTPGQTYYFQVVEQSGDDTWGIIGDPDYRYPGGTLFFNGVAVPCSDLWFREGIVVPEPSSALLLLAGVGALAVFRRSHSCLAHP
jgi:hypothetical protein